MSACASLSGCKGRAIPIPVPISVHDTEWCGDLGSAGAHCAHTLKSETRDIPKAQWDQVRVGMLCVSSSDYTSTQVTQDQLCNQLKVCEYKDQVKIMNLYSRMNALASVTKRARHDKNLMLQQHGLPVLEDTKSDKQLDFFNAPDDEEDRP